jgi:hypothetical protein
MNLFYRPETGDGIVKNHPARRHFLLYHARLLVPVPKLILEFNSERRIGDALCIYGLVRTTLILLGV